MLVQSTGDTERPRSPRVTRRLWVSLAQVKGEKRTHLLFPFSVTAQKSLVPHDKKVIGSININIFGLNETRRKHEENTESKEEDIGRPILR